MLRLYTLQYIRFMKFTWVLSLGLLPFMACTQSGQKNEENINKVKSEYHLISNDDFKTLDCSSTVTRTKVLEFFKKYPQYQEEVKIISIPNCYGDPDEKYFVLLHEPSGNFKIPKFISGSNRPNTANK